MILNLKLPRKMMPDDPDSFQTQKKMKMQKQKPKIEKDYQNLLETSTCLC